MRKKIPFSYFLIFFSLLGLMSLPKAPTESLRGSMIAFLAPAWQQLLAAKTFFNGNSNLENNSQASSNSIDEVHKLRLENTLLKQEINQLKEMMQREMQILAQLTAKEKSPGAHETSNLIRKRHRLEMTKLLQLQLQAIPAKVIFRSPASWNSSLWIDIGTATNDTLGKEVIAKNSPVMVGTSVIGVVDFVGYKQARVRLITDSGLTPSVRAVRNQPSGEPLYLAKGEVYGAGTPLWRSQRHLLKGSGFNYDFGDDEGPARDLRTGKPIDSDAETTALPIVQVGDMLVTTGMDGVFPPDLLIAEVTKVHMLKEGDYYYDLEALPIAGSLDDLSLVFVLPPIGYDADDQPLPIGW